MMKKRKLTSRFALLVNHVCAKKGINQKALAEEMGISLNYLSLMKGGKRGKRLPADRLEIYANVLGVSAAELARALTPEPDIGQITGGGNPPELSDGRRLTYTETLLVQMSREIEARKEAENRYRNIVETMSDMVIRFSVSRNDLATAAINFANEAFFKNVQISASQVMGANPLDSIIQEHRPLFVAAFAKLRKENPSATFEATGKWSGRWRNFSLSLVGDNLYQLVAFDIHDRKCAEIEKENLAKELSGFRQILDILGNAVCVVDTEYNILFSSKAYQELMGKGEGLCYQIYKGLDEPCFICPLRDTFKDGASHQVKNSKVRTGIYCDITTYPLTDAKGNIQAGVKMVRKVPPPEE